MSYSSRLNEETEHLFRAQILSLTADLVSLQQAGRILGSTSVPCAVTSRRPKPYSYTNFLPPAEIAKADQMAKKGPAKKQAVTTKKGATAVKAAPLKQQPVKVCTESCL